MGTDVRMTVTLIDSGVSIDWGSVEIKQAFVYSDAQKAFAGNVVINSTDGNDLVCTYPAPSQLYLGDHRLVIRIEWQGGIATYDAPAFSVVATTAEDDDVLIGADTVEVGIQVTNVSSTILNEILAACQAATDAANAAAADVSGAVDAATTAAQAATDAAEQATIAAAAALNPPQIINDYWWVYDSEQETYVNTGVKASGTDGTDGRDGAAASVAVGTTTTGAAGTNASVTNSGTSSAAVLNFTIPRGAKGDKGDKGDTGATGATGPQGPQGETGATGPQGPAGSAGTAAGFGTPSASVDANTGTPSVTVTASGPNTAKVFNFVFKNLKGATGATGPEGPQGPTGPTGPAGVSSVTVQVGTGSGTPSGSASLNNGVLALSFDGLKGATGADGSQGPAGPTGPAGASAIKTRIDHTSSETSVAGLAWDTLHVWPEVSSLTFTLGTAPSDGYEHQITIVFDTPAALTNFNLGVPSTLLWGNNINLANNLSASTRYEVNINSGSLIALYTEAALATS